MITTFEEMDKLRFMLNYDGDPDYFNAYTRANNLQGMFLFKTARPGAYYRILVRFKNADSRKILWQKYRYPRHTCPQLDCVKVD